MRDHLNLSVASIAALGLFALVQPASAAVVIDFPDNTTLKGRAELQAYNFRSAPAVARQCAGQGGGGTLTITKLVDALSPQLAEVAKAKTGSLLQVDDTKADGTRVAYQLTNATVTGIKAASGGTAPMEQVSFNYTKIQWITVSPCKAPAPPARRNNNTAGGGYGGASGGYGGGGGRY